LCTLSVLSKIALISVSANASSSAGIVTCRTRSRPSASSIR
jgi:hypothetical protein